MEIETLSLKSAPFVLRSVFRSGLFSRKKVGSQRKHPSKKVKKQSVLALLEQTKVCVCPCGFFPLDFSKILKPKRTFCEALLPWLFFLYTNRVREEEGGKSGNCGGICHGTVWNVSLWKAVTPKQLSASTFHNTLLSHCWKLNSDVSLSTCKNEFIWATLFCWGLEKFPFAGVCWLLTVPPHHNFKFEILVFSILYMMLFQKWLNIWGYPWSEIDDMGE